MSKWELKLQKELPWAALVKKAPWVASVGEMVNFILGERSTAAFITELLDG